MKIRARMGDCQAEIGCRAPSASASHTISRRPVRRPPITAPTTSTAARKRAIGLLLADGDPVAVDGSAAIAMGFVAEGVPLGAIARVAEESRIGALMRDATLVAVDVSVGSTIAVFVGSAGDQDTAINAPFPLSARPQPHHWSNQARARPRPQDHPRDDRAPAPANDVRLRSTARSPAGTALSSP